MKQDQLVLGGNIPIVISLTEGQDLELLALQDATGNRVPTFSGVNVWLTPSGNPPVLKTAPNLSDLLRFFKVNGVTYGIHVSETGPTGATGATGPQGINWKGAWSSATAYSVNDAVSRSGSSYIALQPSNSVNAQDPLLASLYWGALCAGGTAGTGTEYVDNFTRANGLVGAGSPPFAYTKIATATANVTSNLLVDNDTTDLDCRYRAEQVMSSADHHASMTINAWTGNGIQEMGIGPCVRFDAAADTCYMALVIVLAGPTWAVRIFKDVAGVFTTLATGANLAGIPVANDVIKLSVAGTTLTSYYNTVQQSQVTDSAITTGVRSGFHMFQHDATTNVKASELRFGV